MIIKKCLSIVFAILLTASQTFSLNAADDKQDLGALADGFGVAMAKKDKAWLDANLSAACVTIIPSGDTMDKSTTIKAFTGEIYDINKSSVDNKTFMVAGADAGGSATYTVEGFARPSGEIIDGSYNLSFKFKKGDKGWQITEILINGN